MLNPIVERIAREAGVPELPDLLVKLAPTDLQSLLLAVYQERARALTPTSVLRQYEQNRFVHPATLDPRQLHALEGVAYGCLPEGFEPVELSPVCPLGTNSAIATVDQNKVITTIRNTEVVSDSTNVLALECANRRQALYRQPHTELADTKLFASHRLVRAQVFSGPASLAHFRILSLVSAGRDQGSFRFESRALREHIEFYLRVLGVLIRTSESRTQIRVALKVFDETRRAAVQTNLLEPLAQSDPEIMFHFDDARASGDGYYVACGFQVFARKGAGPEYMIADGGCTNWMQSLLSNQKERLVISGAGAERLLLLTAPDAGPAEP